MKELIEKLKKSMKYKLDDNQNCIIDTCLIKEAIQALSQSEWIEIDKSKELPTNEVLAINKTSHYIVGYLSFGDDLEVHCTDDCQLLPNVTHYKLLTPPQTK